MTHLNDSWEEPEVGLGPSALARRRVHELSLLQDVGQKLRFRIVREWLDRLIAEADETPGRMGIKGLPTLEQLDSMRSRAETVCRQLDLQPDGVQRRLFRHNQDSRRFKRDENFRLRLQVGMPRRTALAMANLAATHFESNLKYMRPAAYWAALFGYRDEMVIEGFVVDEWLWWDARRSASDAGEAAVREMY